MDAAFSYLTARPRTAGEMERYLYKQQYGEVEVYECIERLKELGYLNDKKFAADFIESRLNTKPVSRRKLREQLRGHDLDGEIIEEALLAVTDEVERKNAAAVAEKYWQQFEGLEEAERKARVIRRLAGRGYDFSIVRESVSAIMGSLEEQDWRGMEEAES